EGEQTISPPVRMPTTSKMRWMRFMVNSAPSSDVVRSCWRRPRQRKPDTSISVLYCNPHANGRGFVDGPGPLSMSAGPAATADPEEENGQEQVDDLVGDQDSPEDRGGHRPDDLRGDAGRPEHGSQPQDDGPLGEELGPKPVDGAVEDG